MRSNRAISDARDAWLAGLLPPVAGIALVAGGSLGRRECVTHSDVDLTLVHNGHPSVAEIADAVWYPIWDAGMGLDHAVRTVDEAVDVARSDVKAALGLLDARYLAGDQSLAESLGRAVRDAWRTNASRWLVELRELTEARWRLHGELAFLTEPDIKEARGGVRDAVLLRALGYTQIIDPPRGVVRDAYWTLLDIRDAAHRVAGRRQERLFLADQDAIAAAMGVDDADVLMRQVADAARTIAHAADTAWRQVERWLSWRQGGPRGARPLPRNAVAAQWQRRAVGRKPRSTRRPLADGVVAHDEDVVLARDTDPGADPALSLRVAAAAATAGLPIGRHTLERLANHAPPMPEVWPEAAVRALVTLLGAGQHTIDTWESCDRYGLVERWLPEWSDVRSLPQRNPVHQYTVDRHLVQTAVNSSAEVRRVVRPDILLLGSLLHDIGKGGTEDHSIRGARIAEGITRRWGLAEADRDAIVRLVRHHLVLVETATRRDLDDPRTITTVTDAIDSNSDLLEILHVLTVADAEATGPAAWSDWKARLVADLVRRTQAALGEGNPPPLRTAASAVSSELIAALGTEPCLVTVVGDQVRIAAPAKVGLLSLAAGVMALHRLDVYAADAVVSDDIAVIVISAAPAFGELPPEEILAADLRRAIAGTLALDEQLNVGPTRRGGAAGPELRWQHDVATDAEVLEVRAADQRGLLYRITAALASVDAEVRAARVDTFGMDVVDAFYLIGDFTDPQRRRDVERAVALGIGAQGH